jgi:small subunit ribosomal protein S35
LLDLSRPFEPPKKDQVLRFRYTTYLGEQHSAANKVVVEFCPSDIPSLTPQQQAKLIKICGPRYNPSTEIVKMSCEMFDSQVQNKRYLSDVVDSLVKEAKDPADTFEDVPFDFRHHKPKQRFQFPEEWLLTPERKRQLEMKRNESLDQDRKRIQQGTVIDGRAFIEGSARAPRIMEPEMVLASPSQKPTQRRPR